MSRTIVSVIIQLLTLGLPMIGVTVGNDQLTGFVQTFIIIATGIYIWIRRVKQGDVTAAGTRL